MVVRIMLRNICIWIIPLTSWHSRSSACQNLLSANDLKRDSDRDRPVRSPVVCQIPQSEHRRSLIIQLQLTNAFYKLNVSWSRCFRAVIVRDDFPGWTDFYMDQMKNLRHTAITRISSLFLNPTIQFLKLLGFVNYSFHWYVWLHIT